jgi:hypothetical protein
MSKLLINRQYRKWLINNKMLKRFQAAEKLLGLRPSKRVDPRHCPLRHKYWLQRNRIDACNVRPSVGVMKQIKLKEKIETSSTPLIHCQHCGGLTRLIGSEPHPVQDDADLLTYCCTACDEFLVLPVESGART